MGKTLAQKIIEAHLVYGAFVPDSEIGIRIDQTLTQDATGTMAYLQFESMHVAKIKTDLSVSYIDHNTVQIGFENADDHRYLQSIAQKYGLYLSRPGNGICHQVHLERFGKPGATLIGADSHTTTAGALGMLAIGVGGLDVALAMAGEPFYFNCPRIIKINLIGSLPPWVSAKDIILKVLRIFTTKGNVGHVFEYGGPGIATLSVPERATIANMGAECGVTTSLFPSDKMTRLFLTAQNREEDWRELAPDPDNVSKVGDKVTTDHIMPAGDLMKYRSNIPKYAEFVFAPLDKEFPMRAKKIKEEGRHNIIVAGLSYGQGSSREHAAICPMYLGVKAVIARSFERIHAANLINFGILPLTFKDEKEYENISEGDRLEVADIRTALMQKDEMIVNNLTRKRTFAVSYDLSDRQKTMLLAGGALNLR